MKARTERRSSAAAHRSSEDRFYALDNSAVFTAAIAGNAGPFVFRLSCDLDHPIELEALSRSMARMKSRFPFFFVELGHGVFWHYLDPVRGDPRVEAERPFPSAPIKYRRGRPLIRVTAYGRRIACDFHHAITDGTGALLFLRALVAQYLVETGVGAHLPREAFGDIPRPGDPLDPEEEEDAYARYFKRESPLPEKSPRAFLLPGRRERDRYRETTGVLSLSAALALAKSMKVTLTELLAAVYAAAVQDVYESLPASVRRAARKTIAIQVPVNLRNIYPSRTLRNFFLFAAPLIDLRLGRWSFEEILRRMHHALRLGLERKELLRQMRRNVGGERNPFGRPIFLPIKTLVMRAINASIGVGAYSGSISNLGAIRMPEPLAASIRRFGFVPARARATGANIGVLSWGDELHVTVGSLVVSRSFERCFFSRLAALELEVIVESNLPYDEGAAT